MGCASFRMTLFKVFLQPAAGVGGRPPEDALEPTTPVRQFR